jgi:hypothetical protein
VAEPEGPPVFGHFPHAERDTLHINAKETIAAEKAILTLDIRNTVLHLYTDSTTLLWYILHWGGKSRKLNAQVRRLWDLCQERDIHIIPHFVPSRDNPADQPSRRPESAGHESSLHPEVMNHILQWAVHLNVCPEWDWMASASNTQLPQWVSVEEDWFRQDLLNINPGWLNPPHHLIPHVLARMQRECPDVRAILLVPHIPNAVWWNLLRPLMSAGSSLMIPPQKYLYGPEHRLIPMGYYKGPLWCTIIQGGGAPSRERRLSERIAPERPSSKRRRKDPPCETCM